MKVLLAAAILVALITPAMATDDEDNAFKWERESRNLVPKTKKPVPKAEALVRGPVLVAIPWTDEADAIRMANDSHYGLAAYVWGHDLGRALRAAHAIEAGWVQVNQGLGQSPGHSYGGLQKKALRRWVFPPRLLPGYNAKKKNQN